jgi:hypothetical protein
MESWAVLLAVQCVKVAASAASRGPGMRAVCVCIAPAAVHLERGMCVCVSCVRATLMAVAIAVQNVCLHELEVANSSESIVRIDIKPDVLRNVVVARALQGGPCLNT